MTFEPETLDYLKGKKFSNSLIVPYSYYEEIPDRVAFLRQYAVGKKVIHLGCLDHQPLIEGKIKSKKWLHKELTDVAAQCIGVDVDQKAMEYVKTTFGFNNILLGDFTSTKFPEIANGQWDFAVLGELLEHIDNPVSFLNAIHNNYKNCIQRIIITVPNAWTQTAMRYANRSAEIINSDHRYWFTPYTLAKVIIQAGFDVEDITFANRIQLSTPQLIRKKLNSLVGIKTKHNYTYASSIVAIAKWKNG